MGQHDRFAHAQICDTKNNQNRTGHYSAEKTSERTQNLRGLHAPKSDKVSYPIDRKHNNQCVNLIGRQLRVKRFRPENIGERHGCKHEDSRKPYYKSLPFKIHCRPSPTRAKGFRDPTIKATGMSIGGGKLGANKRKRNQKNDCGKQIVEN